MGGFLGVDIFFVISGFLISCIIFGNLEKASFSYADFYARRIRRIFPALILVLAASYALGWHFMLPDEFKQLGKHIAAGAGFISNLVLWNETGYFDNANYTKPLLHLWSLGISAVLVALDDTLVLAHHGIRHLSRAIPHRCSSGIPVLSLADLLGDREAGSIQGKRQLENRDSVCVAVHACFHRLQYLSA